MDEEREKDWSQKHGHSVRGRNRQRGNKRFPRHHSVNDRLQHARENVPHFHPSQRYMSNPPDWRTPRHQFDNAFGPRESSRNRPKNLNMVKTEAENLHQNNNRLKCMGFLSLQVLAKTEGKEIISLFNEKKQAFMELLNSPIERLDVYVLVMEILAKVCQSTFDQLKLTILLDVCNSEFIKSLRNYMMDLPYPERKALNALYWKNPTQFWNNFLIFCDCINKLSPSTALAKCRSLIEGTSRVSLEELKERHEFSLNENQSLMLTRLREQLTKNEKENIAVNKHPKNYMHVEDQEPPESFRQLDVIPKRDDLVGESPYLRANVVKGGYRDVEHYLDVQFRLLREDCFGPLRDGIIQFIKDPTKRKYDNIRVFRNVKFVGPYISSQKVGSLVEFDAMTKKRFKNMNWNHNKRFIFGSLVLFTKDNCKTLIVATILDRELKLLCKGMIPVSIVDMSIGADLFKNNTYTMIESEVYFEPYYHVLKALQDPSFPEHLVMKKYIIEVNPEPKSAAYIDENKMYEVQTSDFSTTSFKVLDFETWPSSEELNLNESQYEAYKMALTHEFAVIQGPPGTGKTFLGVKIAKALIENLKVTSGCLLLLVCYTNHALDQFLEAILPITNSIARIGNQSRNEAMEKISLNSLRKTRRLHDSSDRLFFEQRHVLKEIILKLQKAQASIDCLNTCVLSYNCLKSFVPEAYIIADFYQRSYGDYKDPLYRWLFENVVFDFDEQIIFDNDEVEQPGNTAIGISAIEDTDKRNDVYLDDNFSNEMNENFDMNIQITFSIEKAEQELKYLKLHYKSITTNTQEKRELRRKIIVTRTLMRVFNDMVKYQNQGLEASLQGIQDPTTLHITERWMIYFKWTTYVSKHLKEQIQPLQKSFRSTSDNYEEARMIVDYNLLKNVKVIGMTTSGAARLRKLLKALAPPIIIVEEAAEVLEQHIVTSLSKKCQHLILIGDHQQLRPSASYMKLAKNYDIEISLFERMINNNIHSRRLTVQHRMRPQISSLITPAIYPDLVNHPSVQDFPNMRGMTSNVYFLTHDYIEDKLVDDSASKTNHKEGDMVLGLANYIMQQDYKPEDVTILAAYSGQMFYMRKQRSNYTHLSNVKITVVDNYQGEESKIILLSLVRNNDDNKIGFLGTENRICVALSRAKEGFYIFGNIEILKNNSPLWTKIATTLEGLGSIGTSLRLICETHKDQVSIISCPEEFSKVPEGGCLLKCNYSLPCLHACPRMCHGYDRGHVNTKCTMKCERKICELNHVCPLMCNIKCKPCMQLVVKTLPCGHDMKVSCHLEPHDPSVKCLSKVPVKLPRCGHEVQKFCYMKLEAVVCPVACTYRVNRCGHVCTRKCHVDDDPDHERYLCHKPCAKAKNGCTMEFEADRGDHQCAKKCYETCDDCNVEVEKKRSSCKHKERVACSKSPDENPCRKNCARVLSCGHFCKKKCFELCGTDCKQIVKKNIPECGHEISVECRIEASQSLCKGQCERIMSCGHQCRGLCRKQCNSLDCNEIIPKYFISPCGHKVLLPCNVSVPAKGELTINPNILLSYCKEPCKKKLACEHECSGTCGSCVRGCLHVACTQTCFQINVCGHQCKEPCSQVCPPCKQPCEVKCAHSRCNHVCGAPCMPCQEPCNRACPHVKCNRRCGEPCAQAPCRLPCPLTLRCGHPCRGLCGESCPNICKVCRPEDFPKGFIGEELDDDDVFILLEDCGHVLEMNEADGLMYSQDNVVKIPTCPYCRKPIINTPRYKDLVNKIINKEINIIKEKVYGSKENILAKKTEFNEIVEAFPITHELILTDTNYSDWKKAFQKLLPIAISKKKYSLLQLNTYFVILNILEVLSDIRKNYIRTTIRGTTNYENEYFIKKISMICKVLVGNVDKLSHQQQKDIGNEIMRLNAALHFIKIFIHESYAMNKDAPKVKEAVDAARKAIFSLEIYDNNRATEMLKALEHVIKVSGIQTKEDRRMIISAIGAKAGSWYKCPNGHFYNIGQCGGAMEVSRCIECKADIGGSNHRLLSTNRHASEFDNSAFAAYSEEANNLANFDLQF